MDEYLRKRKIKLYFKEEIEPQEVFLDELARKKEGEFGISEKKFEVPISKGILYGFYIVFLIIILVFGVKTFQLQILHGEEFTRKSEENRTRIYLLRPERGVIYDRNLKQLVRNSPSFDLVCDKKDLPADKEQRTKILKRVSRVIGEDLDKLENKIGESESNAVLILENIKHEILILLEGEINNLPGFVIERNTVRNYIDGETYAHLLGYTGKINKEELAIYQNYSVPDYIGKSGIEKSYESLLRGNPGQLKIEKNAFGEKISESKIFDPESGKSLVLWLDSDLQKKAGEALKKQLLITKSKKAAAVALDPRSGGVLALVSIPSFNPNLFSQGISQEELKSIQKDSSAPLFNKTMSGIGYSTGSTIKPLIASAALEEKIISPEKEINCQGVISVNNPYYPRIEPEKYEYHDWKIHGLTDIRKAIAESCNVFFYTVGGGYQSFKGLGPDKIEQWLRQFGWGEKTGIDLPEEGMGILPELNENWTLGNTYHLSIGQGPFSITPLQVANAFAAIANGGKIYQPKVVRKIIDENGSIIENIEPKILRENFIDSQNLKIVREGMRGAVTYGSAVNWLNNLPVKAAAKTGTAQTGTKGIYHNWVTVFAPYDNPSIVLTIVIESVPENMVAALPVAKEILEWYFSQQGTTDNGQ